VRWRARETNKQHVACAGVTIINACTRPKKLLVALQFTSISNSGSTLEMSECAEDFFDKKCSLGHSDRQEGNVWIRWSADPKEDVFGVMVPTGTLLKMTAENDTSDVSVL
jgi:hypothetical protein